MTNGESVVVIEEVHLKNPAPMNRPPGRKFCCLPKRMLGEVLAARHEQRGRDQESEPARWPGEAYGVVGTLQKGDAVTTIDTKGEWTQIQAPTNAYAFMAAQYLKQGGEEMAAVFHAAPEATPATTAMPDMPAVAPATGRLRRRQLRRRIRLPRQLGEAPTAPAVQEPPPPRIVEHEGIVRGSFSIQAPTRYQLVSPDTHVPINYLYAPTTNLDLSQYKGMHIIVTGEEGLDARWKNTPVITIQKIKVLD